jgi:hypothetical protein
MGFSISFVVYLFPSSYKSIFKDLGVGRDDSFMCALPVDGSLDHRGTLPQHEKRKRKRASTLFGSLGAGA